MALLSMLRRAVSIYASRTRFGDDAVINDTRLAVPFELASVGETSL
jgi:hypothetical protein